MFLALLPPLTETLSAAVKSFFEKDTVGKSPQELGDEIQAVLLKNGANVAESWKISNIIEDGIQTLKVQ